MLSIYDCLTGEHDLWLVLLAGVICFLSSLTAVSLIRHARDGRRSRARLAWGSIAAVASGFGIWSTHFIAMLAYQPGLPLGYDLWLTVASALIAIVVTGLGIGLYVGWGRTIGAWTGGGVVGLGIASMHYTGMAAIRLPGYLIYDYAIVASSVVLGVGLGALAFRTMHRWRGNPGLLVATVVLTLAICCMHFSAMGSVTVIPVVEMSLPSDFLSEWWLAVGIAAATVTITALCLFTSLVDQHLMRRSLDETQRLETLTNASTEGIVICTNDRIEYGNTAFLELVRHDVEELSGLSILEFIDDVSFRNALAAMAVEGGIRFECTLRSTSGKTVPVDLLARELPGARHSGRVVLVARDLTEQKRSQARIEYLAHHDALTGLANRVQFNDRLQHDLARAARGNEKLAVLCIDLDRFKEVNDTLGHGSGDELLVGVARRISAAVRDTDTVARLSGDEFAIVQAGAAQPGGAHHLASRLLEVIGRDFQLAGGGATVGASIGIAICPEDGDHPERLLRYADTALYRAKTEGRNTFRFFEADMDRVMRERRDLEADLRGSIDNGELYVEFQPLADAQNGSVVGFEALVRWQHPVRGTLAPSDFIGLAEESGFIILLGQWVLRQACQAAAAWSKPLKVAVNLSPVQFQRGGLTATVRTILAETGLAPERLELEITESVLLADKERAVRILRELKDLGISIAMDDFGTGYSSLSYLQSFPFDKIKIDRSFIAGLRDNDEARAIVKAGIGLSHALNLPMVAEGVEDEFQLQFLRDERCTEVQGYLIGRPDRMGAFDALVSDGEPTRPTTAQTRNPTAQTQNPTAQTRNPTAQTRRTG
jgi:diguanylate cyclase (GGDEF)-like protein/PAS domain S-box-containing protein